MTVSGQIYLVHHAQTPWELTGQLNGFTDLGLTVQGEAQARALAPVLAGGLRRPAYSQVLPRPRLRARRTGELAGLGERLKSDIDLAEWDYGAYEGLRWVDIQRKRPAWTIWRDGCPGGETPADVSARADRLISRVSAASGDVLLFLHGQFGVVLALRWIGLPLMAGQHFALEPASLSILGHDPRQPERRLIVLWNQTAKSCGGA